MFENIKTGWKIGQATAKFIWENKKLMVFPLLSAICFYVVVNFIFLFRLKYAQLGWSFWVIALTSGYFSALFFSIFFNVAATHMTYAYFQGNTHVSITEALKVSFSRIGTISVWTLVAGTIGLILMIINFIEEKTEIPLISWLLGITWSICTLFIIPVICFNPHLNPITLVKDSVATFKNAFGSPKKFSKFIGTGLFYTALFVPIYLLFTIGTHCSSTTIVYSINTLCVILTALLFYFKNVSNDVLFTAFYLYASTGAFPKQINQELLTASLKSTQPPT